MSSKQRRTTNVSALARKLKPYILAWEELRDVASVIVTTETTGGGGITYHDLSSEWHTGKLGWSQIDFVDSDLADILGTLPWGRLSKVGSALVDLENIEHPLIGPHSVTGVKGRVVALTDTDTLGTEATGSDGSLGGVLLRSGQSGDITLVTVNTQNVDHPSDLFLKGSRLNLQPDGDTVSHGVQRSNNFDTGNTGARIDWPNGDVEFRQLIVDSLFAEEFVALVNRAAVGKLIVSPSMALLTRAAIIPTVGNSVKLYVTNIPGVNPEMQAFSNGDHLRIPFSLGGGAGTLGDGAVDGVASNYDVNAGGATTYLDEDFEGLTPPADPTDWKLENPGNQTDGTGAAYWSTWTDPKDGANIVFGPSSNITGSHSNYHAHWNGTGADTLADYRYTGKFLLTDDIVGWDASDCGLGFTLLSKYADGAPADEYIRIRRYGSNSFHVSCHGYSAPAGGTDTSSFTPATEQWYHFKIEVEDDGSNRTDVRARFWAVGSSEPATWDIDCYWTGSSRPQTGTFGFWGHLAEGGEVLYDDILVESLSGGASGVSATVNLDLSTADFALAVITLDDTTAPTVPGGWTLNETSATINGYTSYLYRMTTPSGSSHTFSHAGASFIQATVVKLTGVVVGTGNSDCNDITVSGDLTAPSGSATASNPRLAIELFATHGDVPGGVGYTGGGTVDGTGSNVVQSAHYVYSFLADDAWTGGVLDPIPDQVGAAFRFSIESANPVTGGGLIIGNAYGTVTQNTTTAREDEEQVWDFTVTRVEPTSVTTQFTVPPDTEVLDLGVAGDGVWEASARGSTGTTPYSRVATWDTNPWQLNTKTLMGNVNAVGGRGNWGFWSKHVVGGIESMVELSDAVNLLQNIDLELTDDAGDLNIRLSQASGLTMRAHLEAALEASRTITWATGADLDTSKIEIGPQQTGSFYRLDHNLVHNDATRAPVFSWKAYNNESQLHPEIAVMELSGGRSGVPSYFWVNTQRVVVDADEITAGNYATPVGWIDFTTGDYNWLYWGDYGGTVWQQPQYKKIGDYVFLRGLAKCLSFWTNSEQQTILTMPGGYRPWTGASDLILHTVGRPGGTEQLVRLDLREDGSLLVKETSMNAGDWISLSGLWFSTAA